MVEQVSSLKAGIKYKNTPIGKIPVDWEVVRLGDLAAPIKNAFSDGPFGSNLKLEDYVNSGIPVLQGKNITKNRLEWFDIRYVSKKKAEEHSRSLATVGDILMTKIGTVGCVAIVNDLKGYNYVLIPANLMKITLNRNKIDTYFLYQFLLWATTKKRIIDVSSQTAQPALSLSTMKAFEILCPPLPEQKKIAGILTIVDEAIERTDQIIEKTKEAKKGLMQRLLTRGIGHKKFKKTEIGEIPEEWKVIPLKNVLVKAKTKDPRNRPNHQFKYVDISGISNEFSKITDYQILEGKEAPSRARKEITYKDIIYATVRPYLKRIAIIPKELDSEICSTGFCVVRCNEKLSHYKFIFNILHTDLITERLTDLQRGSNYPAITDKDLYNQFVPLPALAEQKRIAEILYSIDEEIEKESNHKEQLESLKKGLMQVLLTGKIRVSV